MFLHYFNFPYNYIPILSLMCFYSQPELFLFCFSIFLSSELKRKKTPLPIVKNLAGDKVRLRKDIDFFYMKYQPKVLHLSIS